MARGSGKRAGGSSLALTLSMALAAALFLGACAGRSTLEQGTEEPQEPPVSTELSVAPASIGFGDVEVGSSKSVTGTLRAESSDVTISTASWSGTGFSLSDITFPKTIRAGESATFTVTFAPQSGGNVIGGLKFFSNASGSPSEVSLSGSGLESLGHSVLLQWIASSGDVDGYYVHRGLQSGGPYSKISGIQNATNYTDADVIDGETYYYVITAIANSAESSYSNEAKAIVPQ